MLKAEIKPGNEYAFRGQRSPRTLQRTDACSKQSQLRDNGIGQT